jgi:quercetin dioxygenase-like cupin family protein
MRVPIHLTQEQRMKNLRLTIAAIAIALLAGTWGVQRSSAQTAKTAPPAAGAPAMTGFKRVELQKHDLSVQGREVVQARGEFQPGATVPKHTHPGEEIAYILEGEITVELDGKPAKTFKAGDAFFIPAGAVHAAKNAGKGPAVVLSTYVIEKGKPLASPVK